MGEKIIKREVVGSANPFARFFRGLADSIRGIATGLLFIVISFLLIWFSANQMKHSEVIEDLPLMTPAEAVDIDGMVKVQDVPNISNVVVAPLADKDVLYYTYTKEDYAIREVEKTRTITEDGKEIRETYITYEPSWEDVDSSSRWSEFSLGDIEIKPDNAKLKLNLNTLYDKTEELKYNKYLDEEDLVNVPQKEREVVKGVAIDDKLIVVGFNSGGVISSGLDGTFFVSNKSDAELLQSQQETEKTQWWIMVVLAWFLMSTGFTMLLGPITHLLGVIPGLGDLTRSLLFFIFGIISAIILFLAYIGIKFWWLILLIVVGIVGFIMYKKMSQAPEFASEKAVKASAKEATTVETPAKDVEKPEEDEKN